MNNSPCMEDTTVYLKTLYKSGGFKIYPYRLGTLDL